MCNELLRVNGHFRVKSQRRANYKILAASELRVLLVSLLYVLAQANLLLRVIVIFV
jgi:hypothetical protein